MLTTEGVGTSRSRLHFYTCLRHVRLRSSSSVAIANPEIGRAVSRRGIGAEDIACGRKQEVSSAEGSVERPTDGESGGLGSGDRRTDTESVRPLCKMCLSFSRCFLRALICSLSYSMALRSSLSRQWARHVTIASHRFLLIARRGQRADGWQASAFVRLRHTSNK